MPSIQYFQNSDSIKNGFSGKPILFGTVFSVIISLVLILVASMIMLYTGLSQQFIPVISRIILLMSAFSGGIVSGLKSNTTGWLYGGITGVIFFLLLFVLGMILGGDIKFSYIFMILCIICTVLGCIGGIFGINLKPKCKNRTKR